MNDQSVYSGDEGHKDSESGKRGVSTVDRGREGLSKKVKFEEDQKSESWTDLSLAEANSRCRDPAVGVPGLSKEQRGRFGQSHQGSGGR